MLLEVFNNLFMSVADQMGATLANTAWTVNIKERLDFSCAIFDARGDLVANAPHVPVHLGSMSREHPHGDARAWGDRVRPGDAFMLNSPYNGGTHLPDVTVVTPGLHRMNASPSGSARAATMPISAGARRGRARRTRPRSTKRAC